MSFARFSLLLPALALTACAELGIEGQKPAGRPQAEAAAVPAEVATAAATTVAPVPRPTARTAAELDTTSKEQRAAAATPASGGAKLGSTIASLGNPTEPGFWVKTPLVKQATKGRIVNPANGKSANVDLIPLDGPASAGSQVSLAALRLLGVSLTDLPKLDVFKG